MNYNFTPFLRFALKTKYLIENKFVSACDSRMLYVISGSADFECCGRRYNLKAGSLIYYPYDREYRFTKNSELLFYSLNFDFTREYSDIGTMIPLPISEHDPSRVLRTADAVECDLFSEVIFLPDALWARADIQNIYDEQLKKGEGYSEMQSLLLKKIIINIYRSVTDHAEKPLTESIKAIISNRKDIKIKEIAEMIGYHPFYLNEVFKAAEGITLHKYITKERLILAYELITTTKMTVEEIAFECGFSSQAHLSSAFKAVYLVSPGRLRRNH